MAKAVYPGSFDPITNGHLDIIKRALRIFDDLIVAVGTNKNKKYMFDSQERKTLIEKTLEDEGIDNVNVVCFEGLLVNFAKENDANVIIRGLRAMSDFDYEFQLGLTNRKINRDIETVFLLTDLDFLYLNSSTIKEIAEGNGNIKCMVPAIVREKIKEKISR